MLFLPETWKSPGEGTFKLKCIGFVEAGIYHNYALSLLCHIILMFIALPIISINVNVST